jgi:hypothetical protein
MKLFGFFRRRTQTSAARLIRIEASRITPNVHGEMREQLRVLSGKAQQKRQLRNLHIVIPAAALPQSGALRETSDEGDSMRLAA